MDAIYVMKVAIDGEINKEKGKAVVAFAGMKAAFDKIKREEIWRMMQKVGVSKRLKERIEEIYKRTRTSIKIGEKIIGRFATKKGVRQGCPLSTTLFNIVLSDLEEEMSKEQEGGIVIGNKKVWTVTYADDVGLLATTTEGMNMMLKRFKNYLKKKGLELNVEKTKIMELRKGGGRKKETEYKWGEKVLEKTKTFNYLGYWLKENNKEEEHIEQVTKKANKAMGRIWSLGERWMTNNFKLRMRLFDAMIKSIVMYGSEIWGWTEHERVEKLQRKYIKWILKLDKTTPGYLIMMETGREKMAISAGTRGVKYEEKVSGEEKGSLLKECWKVVNRRSCIEGKEKKQALERRNTYGCRIKFLEDRNWNTKELKDKLMNGEKVNIDLEEASKERNKKEWEKKLKESTYAREIKEQERWFEGDKQYLTEINKEGKGASQIIGRLRLGNENRSSKYWLSEEERKCRICKTEEETLEHIIK